MFLSPHGGFLAAGNKVDVLDELIHRRIINSDIVSRNIVVQAQKHSFAGPCCEESDTNRYTPGKFF